MAMDLNGNRSRLVNVFAARLRDWRNARQLPLKQVASDLGVSIAVVSAWENGTRFPTIGHLGTLSDYTDIPAWQWLYCPPNGKSPQPDLR